MSVAILIQVLLWRVCKACVYGFLVLIMFCDDTGCIKNCALRILSTIPDLVDLSSPCFDTPYILHSYWYTFDLFVKLLRIDCVYV